MTGDEDDGDVKTPDVYLGAHAAAAAKFFAVSRSTLYDIAYKQQRSCRQQQRRTLAQPFKYVSNVDSEKR